MNIVIYHSLEDELEKIAVSTTTLFRNVRRAKNVGIHSDARALAAASGGGGVSYSRSAREAKAARDVVKKKFTPTAVTKGLPKWMPASWKSKVKKTYADKVHPGIRQGLDAAPAGAANRGKIVIAPEFIGDSFATMSGKRGPKRMAERGAITAAVGAHELFERGAPKKIQKVFSHRHPNVLLKEHNLLSKLEGPGAEYTRRTMRAGRERTGENRFIRQLVGDAYGPRASQFLQEGRKIPKAMRKNLERKIAANPDIVEKAMRGVPKDPLTAKEKLRHLGRTVRTGYRAGKRG